MLSGGGGAGLGSVATRKQMAQPPGVFGAGVFEDGACDLSQQECATREKRRGVRASQWGQPLRETMPRVWAGAIRRTQVSHQRATREWRRRRAMGSAYPRG